MDRSFCEVALLIALGSCLVVVSSARTHTPLDSNYDPLTYTVPEPQIQVFKQKGFRVSIPHAPGIQLFAFHGNINNPMAGLDAGQFSKDILRRTQGNEWVFEDGHIRLNVGDKIYYWLFVIKDNLGYRYDQGVYEVKDITDRPVDGMGHHNNGINDSHASHHHHRNDDNGDKSSSKKGESGKTRTDVTQQQGPDFDLRICEKTVLNLTQTLLNLQYQIDSLRDTNNILRDMAEKQPKIKSLTLEGTIPLNDDPLVTAQEIIRQKLDLPITVTSAVRNKNGSITFEVATLNEKITIVNAAASKLKNSKIILTY